MGRVLLGRRIATAAEETVALEEIGNLTLKGLLQPVSVFKVPTATAEIIPLQLPGQESQKVTRIGWVTAQQASSLTPYVEAFRSGLADLGYVEGRNLALVLRYGDHHLERVPELATELVQIPVDLIVAQGAANFLINKVDLPVPVVYGFSGDPVIAGFADSLAR